MNKPTPFPALETLREERTAAPLPPDLAPWTGTGKVKTNDSPKPAPAVFPEVKTPAPEPPAPDLEALQRKANEIIRTAHAQAQQIRQQAYEAGYQQGYAEGKQQAQQEMERALQLQIESLRAEVEQFLHSLRAEFDAYLQATETPMLELVMEIARKVIREELRMHPDHILALIRDALRRIKGFGAVRIFVNPADLERVRQHRASLLSVLDGIDQLEILEDRRVEAGSCRIETEQGTYDARLSTQLELIENALRQAG